MTRSGSQIDRRQFVMCSAACALVPSALAAASSKSDLLGELAGLEATREPLALGYWSGTPGVSPDADAELLLDPARLGEANSIDIVPAEFLAAGDSKRWHGGAKVTVHGLIGEVEDLQASGVRSAALQVHFPAAHYRSGDATVPDVVKFNAWSLEGGHVPNLSHGLELQVPVDAGGLELSLDLEQTSAARDRVRRIFIGRSYSEFGGRLGLGSERDQPKLKEGFYFIPLRQQAFSRPGAVSRLQVVGEPSVLLSVACA